MTARHFAPGLAALALLAAPAAGVAAPALRIADPLSFFAGATESISTIKVVMKRPIQSRSVGRGRLLADHSLDLVQHVVEDGKAPFDRRWRIRQVGPGKFTGTMSEAIGPVSIDELPQGYRFRFKLDGNLSVEQWLTPIAGGTAAHNAITVRKFGLTIAKSEGTIRKLN